VVVVMVRKREVIINHPNAQKRRECSWGGAGPGKSTHHSISCPHNITKQFYIDEGGILHLLWKVFEEALQKRHDELTTQMTRRDPPQHLQQQTAWFLGLALV